MWSLPKSQSAFVTSCPDPLSSVSWGMIQTRRDSVSVWNPLTLVFGTLFPMTCFELNCLSQTLSISKFYSFICFVKISSWERFFTRIERKPNSEHAKRFKTSKMTIGRIQQIDQQTQEFRPQAPVEVEPQINERECVCVHMFVSLCVIQTETGPNPPVPPKQIHNLLCLNKCDLVWWSSLCVYMVSCGVEKLEWHTHVCHEYCTHTHTHSH